MQSPRSRKSNITGLPAAGSVAVSAAAGMTWFGCAVAATASISSSAAGAALCMVGLGWVAT